MRRVTRRVEFIEKQKERALRFMKRRSGLVNKARELSTLCGVDACMIIKTPRGIDNNEETVDFTWSSTSDSGVTVQKLIKKYKEVSAEDRRKIVYDLSSYYGDKKRKAESMLASLKKENYEAFRLSRWHSKFESMEEYELRDLANDLEIKIDDLKSRRGLMQSKRIKRVINSNPSSRVDQCLWSTNGDNDLQQVYMMEPRYMNPMAMNSLHYNRNNNSQEIVGNRMKMALNSTEDENNFKYQARIDSQMKMAMNSIEDKMAMNSIEDKNNNYVQPIAMIKPDVVNPMVLPMFHQHTPKDSEPQFSYGPKRFVNYNSVAQTEVDVSSAFSSSFLMNPAMMTTELPRSFVYDHNVLNVSVSEYLSMQQAYACRNSQVEIRVSRQSYYDSSLPPLPPSMLDYSTNGHGSSQMQCSEQLGTLYNFQ